MAHTSKAVYLGNIGNENCGFTVDKEYKINYFSEGDIGTYDDYGVYRYIKNGEFHKFGIREEGEGFVTENECASKATDNNKKPYLRYYINGHEVDVIEFGNVGRTVYELDRDGVKCDTIKFEVKFE